MNRQVYNEADSPVSKKRSLRRSVGFMCSFYSENMSGLFQFQSFDVAILLAAAASHYMCGGPSGGSV
jgi:hypothetical protein